jgi:hypothetical protein
MEIFHFHPVKVARVRRVRRRYRRRGGAIKGTSGSGRYTQAPDVSQGKNALLAIVRQCRRRAVIVKSGESVSGEVRRGEAKHQKPFFDALFCRWMRERLQKIRATPRPARVRQTPSPLSSKPAVFRPGRNGSGSRQVGAVKAGACATRSEAEGVALTEGKPTCLLDSQSAWPVGFVPDFGFKQWARAGSAEFLRKCRSRLFACGGAQATPAWTILVAKYQA